MWRSFTFPHEYLLVSTIIQNVAFTHAEHILLEWVFVSHHACLHGARGVRKLEGAEMINRNTWIYLLHFKRLRLYRN